MVFTCGECSQKFTRADTLKRHISSVHDKQATKHKFQCQTCGAAFSRKDVLKRHYKTHSKPDTQPNLICDICSLGFLRKDNFNKHMLTHRADKSPRILHNASPIATTSQTNQPSTSLSENQSIKPSSTSSEATTSHNQNPSTSTRQTPSTRQVFKPQIYNGELAEVLKAHENSIKDSYRQAKILDILNIDLTKDNVRVDNQVIDSTSRVKSRFKINISPGFILKHKTTGEYRYMHSSSNNALLLDKAMLVASRQHLERFLEKISEMDIFDILIRQRPNSSWQIEMLCNLTCYIFKINHMGRIGGAANLPSYIVNHRAIIPAHKNLKSMRYFSDNLCFFRCLALRLYCVCAGGCKCRSARQGKTRELFTKYRRARGITCSVKQFKGVGLRDLLFMENLFSISITVFQLEPDKTTSVLWSSPSKHKIKLNLNLHDNHFSLIKRLDLYSKAYDCLQCGASYNALCNLKRHKCSGYEQNLRFPNRCFAPDPTIFDRLEESDIYVDSERRIYKYRISYDIECMLPSENLPINTSSMTYSSVHSLLSISTCSNVPGYTKPKTFIINSSEKELVGRFIDYISSISHRARELMVKDFEDIFEILDKQQASQKEVEAKFKDANFSTKYMYSSRSVSKLRSSLLAYLSIIPVFSFNGGRYDLNVMKASLLRYLNSTGKIKYTIKRGANIQCIQTDQFRFLDVVNFIAPGYSYDKYLKAFNVTQTKGVFPYEWLTSLEKLNETSLPPHSAFFSSLRQANISDVEYQECQQVWEREGMKTMRCFLRYYSELDVVPFLEALEKQSKIYEEKGIDFAKSAISLPGLAVRWLFTEVDRTKFDIPLIDERNKDVYRLIKDNLTGGPSIIFRRKAIKNETRVRGGEKFCQKILGIDANALYLHSLAQNMPTGSMIRRRSENDFRVELAQPFGRQAWTWLEYISHTCGVHIQHQFNHGEKRVGQHGLPVDGYCEESATVYQYHGCYWHGHQNCRINSGKTYNKQRKMTFVELYRETMAKEEYIKALGYELISIFECQWLDQIRLDPDTRDFVSSFERQELKDVGPVSDQKILEMVLSDEIYGFLEVDISVPPHLYQKFEEMSPIFKNIEVSRADISPHMFEYAENTDHLKRPQRMLIGSMKGEKILLLSTLLKFYLEEGLVVSKVYQVIQYKAQQCFADFARSVSDSRRMGDQNESLALLAETSKLVGNSVYGKTITNQERHRDVKYLDDDRKASNYIKGDRFVTMDQLDDDFYEMILRKSKTTISTPYHIGAAVLGEAKLTMLRLYYRFMDKFFDRQDFEYIETDTDSAYMQLSGPLESIIKPGLRQQYFEEYGEWFPKPYCSVHRDDFVSIKSASGEWEMRDCCRAQFQYDKRTPGLFKTEFEGDGMIALNSKTYICWSDSDSKCSTKGISKKTNQLNKDQFLEVLENKTKVVGTNRGFILKQGSMYTYSQSRSGLTYFYAKRYVCDDGVTTKPLDI